MGLSGSGEACVTEIAPKFLTRVGPPRNPIHFSSATSCRPVNHLQALKVSRRNKSVPECSAGRGAQRCTTWTKLGIKSWVSTPLLIYPRYSILLYELPYYAGTPPLGGERDSASMWMEAACRSQPLLTSKASSFLPSVSRRAGKTTLLNCLGRHVMPQVGRVLVQGGRQGEPSATIGYVVDSSNFFENVTVRRGET